MLKEMRVFCGLSFMIFVQSLLAVESQPACSIVAAHCPAIIQNCQVQVYCDSTPENATVSLNCLHGEVWPSNVRAHAGMTLLFEVDLQQHENEGTVCDPNSSYPATPIYLMPENIESLMAEAYLLLGSLEDNSGTEVGEASLSE